MGTRARRYPVGGDALPEKVEVTKEMILEALNDHAPKVSSRPDLIIAVAKAVQPEWNYRVPQMTFARKVIDVPAAERLLARMLVDDQVHAYNGPEWYAIGVPSAGLMASAQYYASPESYEHFKAVGDRRKEEARFAKATELATAALIAAHQQEYSELVQKTLASLQGA
jgi:hypothetical protein